MPFTFSVYVGLQEKEITTPKEHPLTRDAGVGEGFLEYLALGIRCSGRYKNVDRASSLRQTLLAAPYSSTPPRLPQQATERRQTQKTANFAFPSKSGAYVMSAGRSVWWCNNSTRWAKNVTDKKNYTLQTA